jgi:hypothetical protein
MATRSYFSQNSVFRLLVFQPAATVKEGQQQHAGSWQVSLRPLVNGETFAGRTYVSNMSLQITLILLIVAAAASVEASWKVTLRHQR